MNRNLKNKIIRNIFRVIEYVTGIYFLLLVFLFILKGQVSLLPDYLLWFWWFIFGVYVGFRIAIYVRDNIDIVDKNPLRVIKDE